MNDISITFGGFEPSYYPGQIVKGYCKITINTNLQAKAISLAFEGNQSTSFTTSRHNSQTNKSEDIHHSQADSICSNRVTLWDDDQRGLLSGSSVLTAGVYEHEFEFKLPYTTMPSTFHGDCGKTEYWVEVCLHKKFSADFIEKHPIRIVDLVPLTKESMSPISMDQLKTICCLWCTGGTIDLDCTVAQKMYLPGDVINIELQIANYSVRHINNFQIYLNRKEIYYANTATHNITTNLAKLIEPLNIPPHSGEYRPLDFRMQLNQNCVPNVNSKLIKTTFELVAKVGISWSCDAVFTFPFGVATTTNHIHNSYFLSQSWPLPVQVNLGRFIDALPLYEHLEKN
eukprot:NODE_80_length_22759_cov_1.466858.p6 type:complete len:343 gc:universal NODE_80_length_22759_cov_1.466858:6391-5363(-)